MLIFGHVGLTVWGVHAVDREADLRLPALLSLLPDVVDKPVAWLFPQLVHHNTRLLGHSLAGAAIVLAVLLAARRRVKRPFLLWSCYLGHFLLDRMWEQENPITLFWPLLGPFPPALPGGHLKLLLLRYNLAGELIGLLLLLDLARRYRLSERERRRDFLKTGITPPADA